MPNMSSDEILRKLKRQADAYAEKSTQLSNILERVECFLSEMPGKLEIKVKGNGDWDILEFTRSQDGWRLWYGPDENGTWVTEGSVQVKAKAARLLPDLISLMMTSHEENLAEIERGLEALNQVPFLRHLISEKK